MLLKFTQPNDHVYRGRTIWVDPTQISSIYDDDTTYGDRCLIGMRDGTERTVQGSKDEVAKLINDALNPPTPSNSANQS